MCIISVLFDNMLNQIKSNQVQNIHVTVVTEALGQKKKKNSVSASLRSKP